MASSVLLASGDFVRKIKRANLYHFLYTRVLYYTNMLLHSEKEIEIKITLAKCREFSEISQTLMNKKSVGIWKKMFAQDWSVTAYINDIFLRVLLKNNATGKHSRSSAIKRSKDTNIRSFIITLKLRTPILGPLFFINRPIL